MNKLFKTKNFDIIDIIVYRYKLFILPFILDSCIRGCQIVLSEESILKKKKNLCVPWMSVICYVNESIIEDLKPSWNEFPLKEWKEITTY